MTEPVLKTPEQPIEKFPGLSKRFTLPGSQIEVVVRKVATDIITLDAVGEQADIGEMLTVAAAFAKSSGKTINDGQPDSMFKTEPKFRTVMEMLRRQSQATMREAVVAPTLDELREIYGGRKDSVDLGMGPDYTFLEKAVNEFNAPAKDGDAAKEEAQDFPGEVGGTATPDGTGIQPTPV